MKATRFKYIPESRTVLISVYDDLTIEGKDYYVKDRIGKVKLELHECMVLMEGEIEEYERHFKKANSISDVFDFDKFIKNLQKYGVYNNILYSSQDCKAKNKENYELPKKEFIKKYFALSKGKSDYGRLSAYLNLYRKFKQDDAFMLDMPQTNEKVKEYAGLFHEAIVRQAYDAKKEVPEEVQKDYRAMFNSSRKDVSILGEPGQIIINIGRSEITKFQNVVLGKKIKIILPNGEERSGQFALVDLSDIIASHNERSFTSSKGYPLNKSGKNINDRNYESDINAQARITEYAMDLKPELLVSTSRSENGTPIIDKYGIVVSGNNRTMSSKLASVQYPEKYSNYKAFLCEELAAFGFPSDKNLDDNENGVMCNDKQFTVTKKGWIFDVKNKTIVLKHPFLVRIDYDFPSYQTQELAKYNQDSKKSKRRVDKAVEVSTILNENIFCNTNIPKVFVEHDRMSDFYASFEEQKQLLTILLNCNLITPQQTPSYFDQGVGFNSDGKNYIETILAGAVLKPEVLAVTEIPGVKIFRQRIITSLPVLMNNKILKKGSLIDHINEAVLYQATLKKSKLKFEDFINQLNVFEDSNPDIEVIYLNRLLDKGGIVFKKAINRYNSTIEKSGSEGLFSSEVVSPSEAFDKIIKSSVESKYQKIIEAYYGSNSSNKDELEQLVLSLKSRGQELLKA